MAVEDKSGVSDSHVASIELSRSRSLLTNKQKWVLGFGLVCFVLSSLFVPWIEIAYPWQGPTREYAQPVGYYFILSAPQKAGRGYRVDTVRYLVPIAVIALSTLAGLFLIAERHKDRPFDDSSKPSS